MSATKRATAKKKEEAETAGPSLPPGLKVAIAPAILLGALGAGAAFGPPIAVLVLAGGTMVGAIAALWHSVRAAFGETELTGADAFAIGAPSAEEEQKRAVLRAIKDLEFEHGVGKISDEDYRALMRRYRDEAKRLLRVIDDDARPERDRAEKIVEEYLRKRGIQPGWLAADAEDEDLDEEDEDLDEEDDDLDEEDDDLDEEDDDLDEEDDDLDEEEEDEEDLDDEDLDEEDLDEEDEDDAYTCAKCGRVSRGDVAFCAKCGAKLEVEDAS